MPAISLSFYILRCSKRRSRDLVNLSALDGNIDLFEEFIKFVDGLHVNSSAAEGAQKVLSVPKKFAAKERIADGFVEIGTYGYGSQLVDIKTKLNSYKRQITDAEMIPLYVRFWCPKDAKFAFLVCQSFSELGCITQIKGGFHSYLRDILPKFTFNFAEMIPSEAIQKMVTDSHLKSISFYHRGIPSDLADKYGGYAVPESDGEIEIKFKSKGRSELGFKEYIKSIMSAKQKPRNILEFDLQLDDLKIEIELSSGKTRMVTLGQFLRMRSKIDVTEDVVLNPDGHPTAESIRKIATQIAMEFMDALAETS